ncbi:MAG: hypothetical protein WDW36_006209 [Sanguina aurantia]
MLMEVVEDGTIATLLVRQMSQPRANLYRDADALRWCVGIADAVAMLHSRSPQIIHRDIKAENIMLGTVDGKKRHTAKLTDFGLHVASSGTPLSEKIFHRWDDPAVLLTGVSPGPSLLERRYVSLPTALEGSHLQPAFSQPQQHLQQQQQQQGERSLSPEEVTVQTGQIVLDSGSAASDGGRRAEGGGVMGPARVPGAPYDFEAVFRLTGNTGSTVYMSPEMHRNQPYNEKTDVYSFGILMYELFSRQLMAPVVAATYANPPMNLRSPLDFSALVADGYRPDRPKRMRVEVWELVQSCWHADPVARPAMSDVLARLLDLQRGEEQEGEALRVSGGAGRGTAWGALLRLSCISC